MVGMSTPEEVAANVQTTLEAAGLLPNGSGHIEERALTGVREVLALVQGTTWASGKFEA